MTRNRIWLATITLAVLVTFGLIGLVLQFTGHTSAARIGRALTQASDPVQKESRLVDSANALIMLYRKLGIQNGAQNQGDAENIVTPDVQSFAAISSILSGSPKDEAAILKEFWESLLIGKPSHELELRSGTDRPTHFANYLVALVYGEAGDLDRGFYYARREFEAYPSRESKNLAINLAVKLHDRDWIEQAEKAPGFIDDLTATQRTNIAKMRQDWAQIALYMPASLFENLSFGTVVTVLISSIAWMIIFFHGAKVGRKSLMSSALLIVAFLLGCVSVFAVDLVYYIKNDIYRIAETGDLGYTFVYNVLCVGLPGETIKLLFFLPILPWILRRNSESDALFAAASVGLGFATIENFGYVEHGGTLLVMIRTLASTTVHFSATGIAGLALARAVSNPSRYFGDFLTAFGLVVALHGCSDALISLTNLADSFPVHQILVVLLAMRFFRLIGTVHEERRDTISLTATYLIANAIVIGSLFLAIVMGSDWIYATKVMSYTLVANLTLMVIFMLQLHETS
jgi:RsiW-degrading membrane proteinase PrsW (M82 family)